ncbi:hypothetical protein MWT96_07530 [Prescottella equi]|uniref:Uncharacterized protein n=1 Tax=Rhodococcus hoagii TaxID=43767 RepID=A0A9Q4ZPV0_RHOHA|nr:hypothetical protein [Prescottella equi]MBM4487293.1 hypothetical protein [Prescottella equi]MBM4487642.1 hypothetical protein [Prescottella equi]MBM4487648.1 hypothetical protein [Prescottella equi]MBM4496686.1 hypothetical protein [Prescottella equi]MBM4500603.1 hypothetical protein [Prescottella equi]
MQWDSTDETLWIVDDGKIYRVTAGVWSAVSVDRETATVPAEIAALIK